jgi:hypothetical protein
MLLNLIITKCAQIILTLISSACFANGYTFKFTVSLQATLKGKNKDGMARVMKIRVRMVHKTKKPKQHSQYWLMLLMFEGDEP